MDKATKLRKLGIKGDEQIMLGTRTVDWVDHIRGVLQICNIDLVQSTKIFNEYWSLHSISDKCDYWNSVGYLLFIIKKGGWLIRKLEKFIRIFF